MRVLLLTKKSPWPAGDGETIAVSNMIDHYLSLGLEVTVLFMVTPKHPYRPKSGEIPVGAEAIPCDVPVSATILGALRNLFSTVPYHLERFTHPDFAARIEQVIEEKRPDLVQLEGLMLTGYLPSLKGKGSKLIYRSHNVEGIIWRRLAGETSNWLNSFYYRLQAHKLMRWERLTGSQFDALMAISRDDLACYTEWWPDQAQTYVPVGFDLDAIEPDTQNTLPASVWFVGALDWIPNTSGLSRFLDKIWPKVSQVFPEAVFHIAGRHAPDGFPGQLPDTVQFHGEVESVASFISDKLICVVPLWAGSGLKIKVVEALAHGRPVITTPVGAEGLPSGVDAFLHIADKDDDFARLLIQALRDPDQAIKTALDGRHFIEDSLSDTPIRGYLRTFINHIHQA